MKMMPKLVLATILCLCSAGVAMGAIDLSCDIDFYGVDGLNKGDYDTGTDVNLEVGQTVSVDILVSGFIGDVGDGNGLTGFGFNLEYGDGLKATTPLIDDDTWLIQKETNDDTKKILTVETLLNFEKDPVYDPETGEGIVLFSFDLTVDSEMAAALVLKDLDDRNNFGTDNEILDDQLGDGLNLATINNGDDPGPGPDPVPVPAAVWLLGSGLTGLLAVRRRAAKS